MGTGTGISCARSQSITKYILTQKKKKKQINWIGNFRSGKVELFIAQKCKAKKEKWKKNVGEITNHHTFIVSMPPHANTSQRRDNSYFNLYFLMCTQWIVGSFIAHSVVLAQFTVRSIFFLKLHSFLFESARAFRIRNRVQHILAALTLTIVLFCAVFLFFFFSRIDSFFRFVIYAKYTHRHRYTFLLQKIIVLIVCLFVLLLVLAQHQIL